VTTKDEPAPAGDRRPIAARSHPASVAVAAFLIRVGASPNGVSIAGMIAALGAGVLLAGTVWWPTLAIPLWLGAALLVQLRLAANMLDGMVAIGARRVSPVGELFNDVPDRVSDSAVLIGLGIAAGNVTLGAFAALAAMATAYVRALGRSIGAPSEFCGPMAKPHRMALITALAVVACVLPPDWRPIASAATLWAIALLALVTTARRLARTAAHMNAAARGVVR
jgi:phosphatidylglycerophosphate synthase